MMIIIMIIIKMIPIMINHSNSNNNDNNSNSNNNDSVNSNVQHSKLMLLDVGPRRAPRSRSTARCSLSAASRT